MLTIIWTGINLKADVSVVASFPIMLLWKVKMRLHQKLGLGIILSLSLVMAVIAIIRIAGVPMKSGEGDLIWGMFWMQQECSIAISTFAITAFRSFFVEGTSTPRRARAVSAYWKEKKRWLLKKVSDDSEQHDVEGLPSIPSATLTGMRTMIRESDNPGGVQQFV